MGLPGAGKSTLARALARRAHLARVDRDAIRADLFPHGCASVAEKRAANARVWREVGALLARGRGVVVDGMTFAARAQRAQARRIARRHGARCVELFLECPAALARERIATDGAHSAPDREPALVDRVARRFAAVSRATARLDARRSTAVLLRSALREVRRG